MGQPFCGQPHSTVVTFAGILYDNNKVQISQGGVPYEKEKIKEYSF
ncbi:MAG: hypothetical protein E7B11_21180 [Clostridiales bacterium]|nr:hypothetical protein [Clostridiales bacterium]MDU3243080.1 hypothetical protein [Clostridiales bacterium]